MNTTEIELDEALAQTMDASDPVALTDEHKKKLKSSEVKAALNSAGWNDFTGWLHRLNCNEARLVHDDWIAELLRRMVLCYSGGHEEAQLVQEHLESGPLDGELKELAQRRIEVMLGFHLPKRYRPKILTGVGEESPWQTDERYM